MRNHIGAREARSPWTTGKLTISIAFDLGGGNAVATRQQVGLAVIPPSKPWHNDLIDSFNGKLRDECLNREWFRDLREAKLLIESWRQFDNYRRPYSTLGYRPPAEVAARGPQMGARLTG